jgi:hypothetical protein
MVLHPDPVTEQGPARYRAAGVYSNDAHGEPVSAEQLGKPVHKGALARAGGTSDPDNESPAGVAVHRFEDFCGLGVASLYEGDEPG